MATKPHKPPSQFWSDFNRLALQFLVLTLRGAIVTYSFQYFGKIRDEESQQSRFERTNFLELRNHVNQLITNRLIVTERIAARLAGRDFDGAKKLEEGPYDEAVQEWNLNVHKLLSPLKRLGACKPKDAGKTQVVHAATAAPEDSLNKSSGAASPPDCLLNYFYDIPMDEAQVTSPGAYVESPHSVHFAFRNAHLTLGQIFQSKWADCRDLIDAVLDRQLADCKDRPPAQVESEIDDRLDCIEGAREVLRHGYDACNREEGAKLLPKLQRELKSVRDRWTVLDARFFELERTYGTASSPTFVSSSR